MGRRECSSSPGGWMLFWSRLLSALHGLHARPAAWQRQQAQLCCCCWRRGASLQATEGFATHVQQQGRPILAPRPVADKAALCAQGRSSATGKSRTSRTPSRASAAVCRTRRFASSMLAQRGRRWTPSPPACTWSGERSIVTFDGGGMWEPGSQRSTDSTAASGAEAGMEVEMRTRHRSRGQGTTVAAREQQSFPGTTAWESEPCGLQGAHGWQCVFRLAFELSIS